MSHNPILSNVKLTSSFLSSLISPKQLIIPEGTTGLLYINGKFMRTLNPGEQDRTPNGTIYTVDMSPHKVVYSYDLPSATHPYLFSVQLAIEYQVENPRLMIDNKILDTEQLVKQTCEPALQRISREVPIEKYNTLITALENAITQKLLSSVGLCLNSSIININHTDYWRNTILPLLKLRQVSHKEDFPTKEINYGFIVTATVAYSISASMNLSESPEIAEGILWKQITYRIRTLCSGYSFRQVRDAEQNIQNDISKQSYEGFGVQIQSIDISIDVDQRAKELLEFEHKKTLEQFKSDLDRMRLTNRGNAIDFYQQFVNIDDPVRKSLMAYILSNNPNDPQSVLNYIDTRDKDLVDQKIKILQTVMDKGDIWDEKTQGIIQDVLNALRGTPVSTPRLEAPKNSATTSDDEVIIINEADIKDETGSNDKTIFKPFGEE